MRQTRYGNDDWGWAKHIVITATIVALILLAQHFGAHDLEVFWIFAVLWAPIREVFQHRTEIWTVHRMGEWVPSVAMAAISWLIFAK